MQSLGHDSSSLWALSSHQAAVESLANSTAKLSLVNHYGLFRAMTGLGGTPVIVLSALLAPKSTSGEMFWEEIDMVSKLGDVDYLPPVCMPCQRRVAWQMWFSALYQSPFATPYFSNLIFRLSQSDDLNGLLTLKNTDTHTTRQLKDFDVKAILIKRYLYRFSNSSNSIWDRSEDATFQTLHLEEHRLKQWKMQLSKTHEAGQLSRRHRWSHLFDWLSFC